MKTASQQTSEIQARMQRRGIVLAFAEINTLRRAEITLQRWAEQECGDSNDFASWAIERDEETGIPYRVTYPHKGGTRRYRVADKEAGALKRVKAICAAHNLHFFHQTDPRGCALYISTEPMTDSNYSNGFAVCD